MVRFRIRSYGIQDENHLDVYEIDFMKLPIATGHLAAMLSEIHLTMESMSLSFGEYEIMAYFDNALNSVQIESIYKNEKIKTTVEKDDFSKPIIRNGSFKVTCEWCGNYLTGNQTNYCSTRCRERDYGRSGV